MFQVQSKIRFAVLQVSGQWAQRQLPKPRDLIVNPRWCNLLLGTLLKCTSRNKFVNLGYIYFYFLGKKKHIVDVRVIVSFHMTLFHLVKPWVIQSLLTFDSMDRTLKCDHSLESC